MPIIKSEYIPFKYYKDISLENFPPIRDVDIIDFTDFFQVLFNNIISSNIQDKTKKRYIKQFRNPYPTKSIIRYIINKVEYNHEEEMVKAILYNRDTKLILEGIIKNKLENWGL